MRKIIFIGVFFCPLFIYAQQVGQTRAVALSGALRGTVGLNEAIYYNPAAFAFANKYSVEGISSVIPGQGDNGTWIYGGSVVDSNRESLSGGLGFYRKVKNLSDNRSTEDVFHLALSQMMSPYVSFGVTGKYILNDSSMTKTQGVNADLGTFFVLTPSVQLGVVGHNVLGSRPDFVRGLGIGSRIQAYKFLFLSLDALKNVEEDQDISLHGGMEVVHLNGVVVQSGLSVSNNPLQNLYSLGLGWSQHKIGLSYAFQNSMAGLHRITHAASLRIFF